MPTGRELLQEHKYQELWQKYCGFIDLSLQEFMGIQRRLLLEQLELLKECELGRHLMRGAAPSTVEEFRRQAPLTTYDDYAHYLDAKREDVLPARPQLWQRTSGSSGVQQYKWAPITERMYQEMGPVAFGILIFATCKGRYDISFGEGENMLYALAPPPYATGCWGRAASGELPVTFLPHLEEAEAMSFEERLAAGLRQGVFQGIDLVFGMPSVLVALGEKIGDPNRKRSSLRPLLTHPRALLRVVSAMAKKRLGGRPLKPRDLWRLRGVATCGTDASLYARRIKDLWGKTPLDVYGSTEGMVIALQTWDHQGMTFLPHFNFLEFIPEEERARAEVNPSYQPMTVLLDEVEPGHNYEVVITNFLGGAFVRYRLGDMVTITARRNDRLNIDIPQMAFYARADGIIDLAGFARLTERIVGQAIERAEVPYVEWTARKEMERDPVLHVYLELRNGHHLSDQQVASAIHRQLREIDTPYREMEDYLGLSPLRVTVLPPGSFMSYMERQRAAGADLAHLKPPHMNPSSHVMAALVQQPAQPPRVPVA